MIDKVYQGYYQEDDLNKNIDMKEVMAIIAKSISSSLPKGLQIPKQQIFTSKDIYNLKTIPGIVDIIFVLQIIGIETIRKEDL